MQSFILKNNESESARLQVLQDAEIDRISGGELYDNDTPRCSGGPAEITVSPGVPGKWDCP